MSRHDQPGSRRRRLVRGALSLALAVLAQHGLTAAAHAAGGILFTPATQPAQPTTADEVSVTMGVSGCPGSTVTVVRLDPVIELRHADAFCSPPPPSYRTVQLGKLPAGSYDLRLVDVTNGASTVDDEAVFEVQPAPSVCPTGQLCVLNDRFAIKAIWRDHDGHLGVGHPVTVTHESGAFWFFSQTNLELMVKVLDGCAVNGHFWVYAGGLTDVEVTLEVTDLALPSHTHSYSSAEGPFTPINDTLTFACSASP